MTGIEAFIGNLLDFINYPLIPFILAIAFFFFIWNITRYFIIQGQSEDAREKARMHALWGVAAFVLIISFWGIIHLLISSFGLGSEPPINPDFIDNSTYNSGNGGSGTLGDIFGGGGSNSLQSGSGNDNLTN